MARRSPHREGPARHYDQKKVGDYFSAELLRHYQRQLPHPVRCWIRCGRSAWTGFCSPRTFPFENMEDAAEWLDACDINEYDKRKIARENAIKLLKLEKALAAHV